MGALRHFPTLSFCFCKIRRFIGTISSVCMRHDPCIPNSITTWEAMSELLLRNVKDILFYTGQGMQSSQCCSCWYWLGGLFPCVVCNLRFLSSLSAAVCCGKLFALLCAGKFVSTEALCSHWAHVYVSFLLWHPCELKPHTRVITKLISFGSWQAS